MTFQQAMAATSRELNARATITCVDAFVISNTPVMSFSVEEGGQVTLGSVTSSRYTLSLPNGGGEWLKNGSILGNRSLTGARVQIQIGVYHDGAWDWQNAGLFIVEKTSAPEFSAAIKLIGNDPIISLDRAYDDQLAYRSTTTLGDILTHIKSKGVTITGSLACNASATVNFQPDWGEEPTIRDALGYVLQMGGSFARCDRAGNITIAPANGSTTHAITTDKYTEFTDDERYFNFNRIKILPNGAKKNAAYVESYVTSAAESAANTLCLESNPLFKTKTTTSYVSLSTAEEAAGLKNRKYYVKIGNKYEVVAEPAEASMTLYYKANKSYNTATLQAMADGLKTALTGMSFRAITFKWRGDPTVLVGDKVTLTDTRGVSVTTVILQQSLRYEGGFSAEISCPIDLTAVTPATLTSSGAWTPPYFGTGTIDGSVIMPESITGDLVVAGGITAEKIASKTVTADEIAAKTITADEIKAGTITADEIAAKTITADEIAAGTITADEIGASQITATHIGTNEIVANTANIKDGVITNAKIANGTIENAKIKDATIETAKIKDAAITTAKIQDAQITNAKIAAAGIDFANIKDVVAGTSIFRQGVGDALYLDRLVVNDANFASAIAGKLMIRDTDGKLYRISVNSSGAVTATQVQVNGDSLTDNAVMSVSQRLLWRQAAQPSAPWVGMLWLDTTTEKLKRCTAITPSVAWEVVPAGEVHTAVIDVDDNGMNILSGGNLNLLAGGNLNIKNLGDTANVINMDNTGMTISSTGKLDLQSTANLNIQNGGNLNVLNGGDIEVNNGGDINVASGGKINVSATDLIISGKTVETYASDKIRLEVSVGGTNLLLGTEAVRTIFAATPAATSEIFQWFTLEPNTTYTLSGKYQIDWNSAGFAIYLLSDWGAPSTIFGWNFATKGVVTHFSQTFTTPATYTSYRIEVYNQGSPTSVSTWNTYTKFKLEKGNKATDWSPSPKDPASGVKTSYIDIATDHIDISTGGNITMSAGALMKLLAAVVQIDASDASNSYINFGNAFNVSKGSDGNFALTINSPTDNAIMVNNKPVWHKGNILVQQSQPASGSGVLWMKPVTTSQVIYAMTVASKSSSTYAGGGYKEYTLANQNTDVMSAAGTYSFALKFTLRHYGDGNYTVSQITITLTKGGKTLTLYTGSVTVGGWSSKEVTATATTTDTEFTSGTGVINCKIQPSGTIPYSVSDFLAHEVGSPITATITGPGGGGSAQLCEVKYVP